MRTPVGRAALVAENRQVIHEIIARGTLLAGPEQGAINATCAVGNAIYGDSEL